LKKNSYISPIHAALLQEKACI